MGQDKSKREVFAHVSTSAIIRIALFLPVSVTVTAFLLRSEVLDHRLSARVTEPGGYDVMRHFWYVGALTVCLVLFLLLMWPAIRQVRGYAAAKGAALWIEGGHLVHADRKSLDVPLTDIKSVEECDIRQRRSAISIPERTIAVNLKDGRRKLVAAYFVEDRFEVVQALRRRIGLPEV